MGGAAVAWWRRQHADLLDRDRVSLAGVMLSDACWGDCALLRAF